MRKNFLTVIALLAVFALVFAGCGKEEAAETTAAVETSIAETTAQPLGLADWSMSTTTWSSPNGATVNLTATPTGYTDGQSAAFVVRVEGEEVANVACEWNGTAYTAAADLTAANDLCYYVVLTAADGTVTEVAVNTPAQPTDDTLINLESSLASYCNLMVDETTFADDKLTVTAGSVTVQAPKITNEGQEITLSEAALVLSFHGEEVGREKLTLTETEAVGGYAMELSGITFTVPEMENDQQLNLTLNVTLSNGHTLSAAGGTFYYNDGELLTAVG